ncbi:MAG TPA: hypothetical protein HA282_01810 [Nanoarchaeota archaeon]|nr:MAG: hypothetical protein QT01_C0005G0043 [archaeon GW2011_AR6]MBS3082640.1 hypothetical protein [Candidatus Pacearchaeota archaeon]HIH17421.1 hypothetical protein [Nanoarchaeota archaeon]HIH34359.1 hypothetical protein [Nanoarchaeota archaeon]HIH51885.1 hypothetical protein [Nanoarchaeota archaeon]
MVKDNLNNLKKEYTKVKVKYKLPEFAKLNSEFEIEKLAGKKTDFLLRGIRRNIEQRAGNFLKMLEEFVNPSFASVASLTLMKSFTERERLLVKNSYENIVDLMLKAAILEIDYNEKREAGFINDAVKIWEVTKKDLAELMVTAERIWKQKIVDEKVDYNYFG